jgi:DNA-binding NarL/FixJ family response regulator
MSVRVMVVDDQALIRDGLTTLLDATAGVEPVAAAANGAEAVSLADEHRPDVILMDLRMPVLDGVDATRQIKAAHPEIEIVVLTTHADDASILSALGAGARGYLTKDAGIAEISRAVQAAAAGQGLLDPVVQARLLAAANGAALPRAAAGTDAHSPGDRRAGGVPPRPPPPPHPGWRSRLSPLPSGAAPPPESRTPPPGRSSPRPARRAAGRGRRSPGPWASA